MIKKVLSYINLHPDKNQSWLLVSLAISGLLITYAHPTLVKEIISNLPAQWIAFESMTASIAGLSIGVIWQKNVRKKTIRYFLYLVISESLCGSLLGLYLCFINWNAWVFAIASLIYSTIISIFVGKCIMAFKAKLWVEKEREIYDNNVSITNGIVCVIGYLLALITLPPLKVSLFLWSICCIIDDIGWIIVYNKNKEALIKIE